RKLPIPVLVRALGFSTDQELLDLLGDNEYLRNALDKDNTETTDQALLEIYERLRQGEPPQVENAQSRIYSGFFDPNRDDLARVGRYKMNKKLHLKHRLFNQTLAEPIVDVETGEIAAEEGTVLDRRNLDKIIDVLESNANIQVYELNSSVLDEPV